MKKTIFIIIYLLAHSFVANSQTTQDFWTKISCGGKHVIALMSDSTIRSWGYNGYGQSGTGDIFAYGVPTLAGIDNDWISVDAGYMHSLAMKSDSSIWGWGMNHQGQAGQIELGPILTPTQIGTDTDWKCLAAGNYSGHAIKADGSLWSWGLNAYCSLGINSGVTDLIVTQPVQVGTEYDWDKLYIGEFICYASKTDGSLWAWGYNFNGQIPNALPGHIPAPVLVDNSGDWVNISSGHYQVCGLKDDGTLWVWGYNLYGALGTGDPEETFYDTPTQIGIDNDWDQVYAGYHHCLAIKTNGSVWGWGKNDSGALGLGTTTNVFTPIMLNTEQNWAKIFAGENFSIIIDSTGTHFCAAGTNTSHQLGNCFLTDYETPFICNTVRHPISITNQSMNSVFCNESDGLIFVEADNDASQFWMYSTDNGLSWFGLPDDGTYIGLNSSELIIPYIDESFNNWQYKCILGADCFHYDTTDIITISVFSPNTTVSQNLNTLCAENLNGTYQWFNCDSQTIVSNENELCFTSEEDGHFALVIQENECKDTSDCILIQYTDIIELNKPKESLMVHFFNNYLQLDSKIESEIKIFDNAGRFVLKKQIGVGVTVIDFSPNKPGIYLIERTSEQKHEYFKLLYQN